MKKLFVLVVLLLLPAACRQGPLPTPAPVAELPTDPPPTATTLPPTTDLTALTVTPEPTAVPTVGPTATPTTVNPLISITDPDPQSDLILGSDVAVRGLVQRDPDQAVWLVLRSANGRFLAETEASAAEGAWQAGLTIPIFVSGYGVLQASVRTTDGDIVAQNELPVNLALETADADRYLDLYRPNTGEIAVGGFNIFFDGRAERPVNNTVTISIWVEECQTQIARQSFVLRGSGYWQGFVVVPPDNAGPGCAVAHFGEPDTESWREAQIPITILATDDPAAKGVIIGNPPPDSTVTAGQEVLLYGTAYNTSDAPVSVSVLLENGRIITESSTQADFWGYWEYLLVLPFDVEGPAKITVSAGGEGGAEYAEASTLLTILPAPTPTPGPPATATPEP